MLDAFHTYFSGLGTLGVFLEVVLIDIALAGDNAIVIGALAGGLPERQRRLVILLGVAAALVLRIGFALVAVRLLDIVGLLFAGGLLLLWVCWKLFRDVRVNAHNAHDGQHKADKPVKTAWQAAWAVAVADVSMSLDNVLAVAGAAKDHPAALAVGLILSVVLMGAAANRIAVLMERYPSLLYLGILVIFAVSLKMIWEGLHDIMAAPSVIAWLA